MSTIRNICVYCGSGPGTDPRFVKAAHAFGAILAENDIGLVYGGGSVGLMGATAAVAGQNLGAGYPERSARSAQVAAGIGLAVAAVVGARATPGGVTGASECRRRHGDGRWRSVEATIRNLPFDAPPPDGPCVKCDRPAVATAYFAKAY